MRAQYELLTLSQMEKCTCDFLHSAFHLGRGMLQPVELYRAKGFPEWYIIDKDFRGVKYAKDKQVARCGNAVPPPFAEALVRANLPDFCTTKNKAA